MARRSEMKGMYTAVRWFGMGGSDKTKPPPVQRGAPQQQPSAVVPEYKAYYLDHRATKQDALTIIVNFNDQLKNIDRYIMEQARTLKADLNDDYLLKQVCLNFSTKYLNLTDTEKCIFNLPSQTQNQPEEDEAQEETAESAQQQQKPKPNANDVLKLGKTKEQTHVIQCCVDMGDIMRAMLMYLQTKQQNINAGRDDRISSRTLMDLWTMILHSLMQIEGIFFEYSFFQSTNRWAKTFEQIQKEVLLEEDNFLQSKISTTKNISYYANKLAERDEEILNKTKEYSEQTRNMQLAQLMDIISTNQQRERRDISRRFGLQDVDTLQTRLMREKQEEERKKSAAAQQQRGSSSSRSYSSGWRLFS